MQNTMKKNAVAYQHLLLFCIIIKPVKCVIA